MSEALQYNVTVSLGAASISGIYNVMDYGAVGDGSTDDTAAIQSAIDACEAGGGGYVDFLQLDYLVTSTLTIQSSGVILRGLGGGWDGSRFGTTITFDMTTVNTDGIAISNASSVIYRVGIEKMGLIAVGQSDLRNMVLLDGCRQADINDVVLHCNRAYGTGSAALKIDGSVQSSTINLIRNCEITVPSFDTSGARCEGIGISLRSSGATSKFNNGNLFHNLTINGPATHDDCPAIYIGGDTESESLYNSGHKFTNVYVDCSDGGGVHIGGNASSFSNLAIDCSASDTCLFIGQYGTRATLAPFTYNGLIDVNASLAAGREPVLFTAGTKAGEYLDGPNLPTMTFTPRDADPTTASEGQLYYNSVSHEWRGYNGTSWYSLDMTVVP